MTELERKKCPVCGIEYAVDADVMRYKRNAPSGDRDRHWYCPNGHNLVFTESEADKQRRRAEFAEQQNARLRDELAAAERQRAAAKGQVTRLRNRAANGVCPCCTRSFANLRRHMAAKHPDFKAEAVA